MSEGKHTAHYPCATVYGIETYYCDGCKTPEPDGWADQEIWDETGEALCPDCARSVRAQGERG